MKTDIKYLATSNNLSQVYFTSEQKGNLIQRGIALNMLINVRKLLWQCVSKPGCSGCVCIQGCLAQSKLQ